MEYPKRHPNLPSAAVFQESTLFSNDIPCSWPSWAAMLAKLKVDMLAFKWNYFIRVYISRTVLCDCSRLAKFILTSQKWALEFWHCLVLFAGKGGHTNKNSDAQGKRVAEG